MNKENTVYTYNGVLFSLKKKGNSGLLYNMNETWRHYARWNKPEKNDEYCMSPLIWGA